MIRYLIFFLIWIILIVTVSVDSLHSDYSQGSYYRKLRVYKWDGKIYGYDTTRGDINFKISSPEEHRIGVNIFADRDSVSVGDSVYHKENSNTIYVVNSNKKRIVKDIDMYYRPDYSYEINEKLGLKNLSYLEYLQRVKREFTH